MLAGRRYASGDTTTIIHTRARLTASMGPTGLWVECLSAPAPGMAGDVLGVGVVGAVAGVDAVGTVMGEGLAAAGSLVAEALPADAASRAVRLAAFTVVVDSMARADSMAAEASRVVAPSTVAAVVGSTAAAVADTAVDTGNRGPILSSPVR